MIGQTISHYKILEKLGEGGMGVVYKAEDTRLHRTVALKLLLQDRRISKPDSTRFAREAQAAARLNHPNIATIFEYDEVEDPTTHSTQSFIAMEFVEGETLKDLIRRGPLPFDRVRTIAEQIARGLSVAHQRGIIHRDIKPTNIVLTRDGIAKLLDFGIAKFTEEPTHSSSAAIIGSVAYMSPEQATGGKTDARSDIWSLGVVLFEMLTGQLPFRGEHTPAMMYSLINEEARDVRELRPDTPDDLQSLVRQCLSKVPSERPQTISDFFSTLGIPIRTVTPDWLDSIPYFIRHHRYKVAGAVLIPATLFVVFSNILTEPDISLGFNDHIVIGDVVNNSGDTLITHALAEAFRISLRQSARLNVLPVERVTEALQHMQLPPDHVIDRPTALSIARREGAPVVLTSEMNRLESGYLLSCRLVEAETGEGLKYFQKEIPSIRASLGAIDELSHGIRRALGESSSEISTSNLPLARVSTQSIEALELFSRGNRFEAQGDYPAAALLKEKAFDIDSTFLMAVSDLSYIHHKLGNDSLALIFHHRVLPLLDRVTDRESYEILTRYYGPDFEYDYPKAFRYAQQLVLRYPNYADGFASLGYLAMYAGDFRAAIEANENYLLRDSVYAGIVSNNMGYTYAYMGNPQKAIEYFNRSKALRPMYYTIDTYRARAHWIAEQFDSTELILKSVLPLVQRDRQFHIHGQLAGFYYFRGQSKLAGQQLLAAIENCRVHQRDAESSFFRYFLAEVFYDQGRIMEYQSLIDQSIARSKSPYIEYALAGASLARHGFPGKSQKVFDLLNNVQSNHPYFLKRKNDLLNFLRGSILMGQRSSSRAISEFRKISKIESGDPLCFLALKRIGECYAELNDTTAVTVFNQLLDLRGEVICGTMLQTRASSFWIQWFWPEVHLDLANQFSHTNKPEALRQVEKTLSLWKHGDGQNPKIMKAIELRTQLTGVR